MQLCEYLRNRATLKKKEHLYPKGVWIKQKVTEPL